MQKKLIPAVFFVFAACGEQAKEPALLDNQPNIGDLRTFDNESLRKTAQTQVDAYASALRTADTDMLQKIAASDLLQRIATRGPAGSPAQRTAAFLQREGKKLQRAADAAVAALATPAASASPQLAVVGVEALDARVLSARLTLNGREVPKPFYLLLEPSGLKVNVTVPRGEVSLASTSNYRVENDDLDSRSFACSGNGPYNIARFPAQRQVRCEDSCSWLWFDGTTFQIGGEETDCDYNTWGVDMYIRDNAPICNDPC